MSRRLVYPGVAIALLVLAGAIAVACFTAPTPDCGFVCGSAGACPDGYTCADDHRCHRIGAPAGLVCLEPDAALPIDAGPDAPDAMPDASIDAPPDAPPDAPVDAPPDAPVDAPPDAPVDAPPDAEPDATIDGSIDAPDADIDAP